jgi:hypothetical protein
MVVPGFEQFREKINGPGYLGPLDNQNLWPRLWLTDSSSVGSNSRVLITADQVNLVLSRLEQKGLFLCDNGVMTERQAREQNYHQKKQDGKLFNFREIQELYDQKFYIFISRDVGGEYSSYSMKHRWEEFFGIKNGGHYVSNGQCILVMLLEGFDWHKTENDTSRDLSFRVGEDLPLHYFVNYCEIRTRCPVTPDLNKIDIILTKLRGMGLGLTHEGIMSIDNSSQRVICFPSNLDLGRIQNICNQRFDTLLHRNLSGKCPSSKINDLWNKYFTERYDTRYSVSNGECILVMLLHEFDFRKSKLGSDPNVRFKINDHSRLFSLNFSRQYVS